MKFGFCQEIQQYDVMMTSCNVIANQVMPSNFGGPIKSGFEVIGGGRGTGLRSPPPVPGSKKKKRVLHRVKLIHLQVNISAKEIFMLKGRIQTSLILILRLRVFLFLIC